MERSVSRQQGTFIDYMNIYGIRHHGPGSARSLLKALEEQQPDSILIEGPPDANDLIAMAMHEDMLPPVALLLYVSDEPHRAVFYPFAEFSPEWQAIKFALSRDIPVKFIDLPVSHSLALKDKDSDIEEGDPLQTLAEIAGHSDSEAWWNNVIEEASHQFNIFTTISDLFTTVREHENISNYNQLREAWMRKTIRAAIESGAANISVICGAWHAPALKLDSAPSEKEDLALLKGLSKVKLEATWIPWTNDRLSIQSGYGAGIKSPGWYSHLWNNNSDISIRWMAKVAQIFREEDLDVSSAHLIESVRLADALAAIRSQQAPGLDELNEATRTILCFGDDQPLKLIHEKLMVGEVIGHVPEIVPSPPLLKDFNKELKRLRLSAEAIEKNIDLDLRKKIDLDRSRLFHRLVLLNIHWGKILHAKGKGTFREVWQLKWHPELAVKIIESGIWGKSIFEAAVSYTRHHSETIDNLPDMCDLLSLTATADLPQAVEYIVSKLQSMTAVSTDVLSLMKAVPSLASTVRYGDVRKTEASMIDNIISGLITRICISLPGACSSLDDDAANEMITHVSQVNETLNVLQQNEYLNLWEEVILRLSAQHGGHGLIAGYSTRLSKDSGRLRKNDVLDRISFALSVGGDTTQSAYWMEGFLKGSGSILLYDDDLLSIVDDWVTALNDDSFQSVLPLIRRTFAAFTPPERQKIGSVIKHGKIQRPIAEYDIDEVRAERIIPLITQLLGGGLNNAK